MYGQVEKEIDPPYHIKTITFTQSGQNQIPIFKNLIQFRHPNPDLIKICPNLPNLLENTQKLVNLIENY